MTTEILNDMQAAVNSALKLGDMEAYLGIKSRLFVETYRAWEGR